MGFGWMVKANFDKTVEIETKAISIGKELNDAKLLGACYNTLGLLNQQSGYMGKSIDNFLLALENREAANDSNGMAATLNNLGESYRTFGLHDKALESLHKAEKIYL